MAQICDRCGKGRIIGHHLRHHKGVAGGRWKRKAQKKKRQFKPNLHSLRVEWFGIKRRMRLCTKCLRGVKEQMQIARKVAEELQREKEAKKEEKKEKEKIKAERKIVFSS